jgi:hypothetical protein
VRAIGLPDPSRRRNLCWSNATAITSAVREGDAPFTLNEASDSERQLIFQRCCNRTRPFDLRLAIGTRTSTSADARIRHCNVAADVRLDFDRGRRRTLPATFGGQLAVKCLARARTGSRGITNRGKPGSATGERPGKNGGTRASWPRGVKKCRRWI